MEIALLTFSAISAISTVVIAVLLFQIQKSLNTNKIQQEKLLRLVEATNELNKQIGQITTEANRKQTEYSETFENQFDNLIQRIEIFDNYLNELLQGNNKSSDRLYNLLCGNTNIQLEKLQAAVTEYSETFENQFDNLIQRIEIFDNYLNELLQGNNKSSDRLYNLLYGNTNIQLEKLQAAVDELKALKASLEESVRF